MDEKMKKFKFELGDTLDDTVTGYTGVATARCEYLGVENARYCLENMENGKPVEVWFDENRLRKCDSDGQK